MERKQRAMLEILQEDNELYVSFMFAFDTTEEATKVHNAFEVLLDGEGGVKRLLAALSEAVI
jgi:hypothetical protein